MGTPVEKSNLISVSYEEGAAPYHNESLGMSIAPEDAARLVETGDQYQAQDPSLDLYSDVAVHQNGAPQRVQLRTLIVEAGQGTAWAVAELDFFLSKGLGPVDSQELNVCFDACEANVADILVQLKQGDGVQREEASKSLLGVILGQPYDGGDSLPDLQRGLLVAAGQISRQTQGEEFYQEVARLDEAQRSRLWEISRDSRLQPDPKLLVTLKNLQTPTQQISKSDPRDLPKREAASPQGGGNPPVVKEARQGQAVSPAFPPAGAPSQALAVQGGTPALIEQILTENFSRISQEHSYLPPNGGKALTQRLTEIVLNPRLTPVQISQTLYHAVLARAWAHDAFTSAEKNYGEFRPVAARIAGMIVSRLGLAGKDSAEPRRDFTPQPHGGNGILTQPWRPPAGRQEAIFSNKAYAHRTPAAFLSPSQSLGLFTGSEGGTPTGVLSSYANSSAAAAGMMGIPFLSLVAAHPLQGPSSKSQNRPRYFIEGPSATPGESHGGTGGQSSGQGRERQGQGKNPETVFVA